MRTFKSKQLITTAVGMLKIMLKDLLEDPEIQARIENKLEQIGAET